MPLQMPPSKRRTTARGRHSHQEIKSSDIPSVTGLQRALGFGNKGNSENAKFRKTVKEHLNGSKTKDNRPGSSLTKWRDLFERDALYDMAKEFLETIGLEFWPDGATDSDTQLYRYSRDHEKLVSLLAQLFFRVNTQSKGAARRKVLADDSLNQTSSSIIHSSPRPSRTIVESSPDQLSSPVYNRRDRSPSGEIDLYHGPHSEDEYTPARKRHGKRPAAAQSEEHSPQTKLPRNDESDTRDPFENYTISQFPVQTQSPNMTGRRASSEPFFALGLSPESHIAEDTTSDSFGTLPIHYDTPDPSVDESGVVYETIEMGDGGGHVATGVDGVGDISNRVEVKEDTRSPTLDVMRYPEYPRDMNSTPLPPLLNAQSTTENDFFPETSPGVDQEVDLQARQRLMSKEQDLLHQQSPQEPEIAINAPGSDREGTTAPSFSIDYTVYDHKREPAPVWHLPQDFFNTSFDELLEALSFARPCGLSICVENDFSDKKFQRTARTQARFSALQEMFMRIMEDVKDKALERGIVPNFEIIIYHLE